MPCSPARLAANRRNATRSTGPKSVPGKIQSRSNAVKHGLTGAGVAVPTEDAAAIAARFENFAEVLNPRNAVQAVLVQRAAVHSVRMERGPIYESAMIAQAMRHAATTHDADAAARVSGLIGRLKTEPDIVAPLLRATPQGIDWMIQEWEDLIAVLPTHNHQLSSWDLAQRAHRLLGRRPDRLGPSEYLTEISKVTRTAPPLSGMPGPPPESFAAAAAAMTLLRTWVDAEIAALQQERADAVARSEADRNEAAARALFDASTRATLARRYEAAAERGLFRALRELEQQQRAEIEAEAQEEPEAEPETLVPEPEPVPAPAQEAVAAARPLGSFGAGVKPARTIEPHRSVAVIDDLDTSVSSQDRVPSGVLNVSTSRLPLVVESVGR